MKLNVIYSASETYAQHAYVSIFSLLEKNKIFDEINIYFITDNMTENTKEKIKYLVKKYRRNLLFINSDDILRESAKIKCWNGSNVLNCKLFLGSYLDNTIDKVLYLDSDSVIMDSLLNVWETDIEDYYCAGVFLPTVPKYKTYFDSIDEYLNPGFILINLKKWRNDYLEEKIVDYLKKNSKKELSDEFLINILCENKIKHLSIKYNLVPEFYFFKSEEMKKIHQCESFYTQQEIDNALKNPVFIHFLGHLYNRPWNKECTHPAKNIYLYYLERSPWKNALGNEKLPLKNKLMVFLYKVLPFKVFLFLKNKLERGANRQ